MQAEYVRVEGEHSALTVCIAASTVGARAFTATSANGLLYMHEQIHWAAGSRLPIVLCCVNRGVGAPWTILNDQQDAVAQRDTGWIQLYCRDNQEIIDTVLQAFRIAEQVFCPVMVCYDGFILSHTLMPVEIPEPEEVDRFLPPYRPFRYLSEADPVTINPVMFADRQKTPRGSSATATWRCATNLSAPSKGPKRRLVRFPKLLPVILVVTTADSSGNTIPMMRR